MWRQGSARPLDESAMERATRHIDALVKPLGSLGRLEQMAIQLAGIFGEIPRTLTQRRVVVFSSDNGVWQEGISPVPQSVTLMQTLNMTRGLSGMCALAQYAQCQVRLVDMGINAQFSHPDIRDEKIAMGTGNIAREAAMTRAQCERALEVGYRMAFEARREGVMLLAPGEMGICNTTTSSAVLSALTGLAPDQTVGKGAGLTPEQFEKKRACVAQALRVNAPDAADPVDVLARVGGFDLCAMTGMFVGGAHAGLAMLIDGFIAMVAALCAVRLDAGARAYLFPTHISHEQAFLAAAREVGVTPYLDMEMRLGEGSGCPLAMLMMEAACRMAHDMGTFEEAQIDISDYVDLRK